MLKRNEIMDIAADLGQIRIRVFKSSDPAFEKARFRFFLTCRIRIYLNTRIDKKVF